MAFDAVARENFEEEGNGALNTSTDGLWGKLEARLCNQTHEAALKDQIFDKRWHDRKETFSSPTQRLRSTSLALPNGLSEDVLLNWLKAGIPPKLWDQAHLVAGSFDDVVSKISRITAAQMTGEPVCGVGEDDSQGNDDDRCANYILPACQTGGHIAR